MKRPFQALGLQQHGQTGQRAFAGGRRSQRRQRRPKMLLGFRRHVDLFAGENGCDPFRRPAALGRIVDHGKRLQGDRFGGAVGQRTAEIVPIALHGERRGPDRPAEVEGKDLGARIPAELQRHQREQYGFAGTGRTDHQRMPDVPDVEGEAKRRGSFRPRKEQRRRAEMRVPRRPGPNRGQRDHMGDVQGRDRRLADVGIDVAGQRAQPGIDRVDGLHHAGEVASLNDLLDQAQPFIRDARILVPDRDRGGDKGLADQVGAEFLQRGVGVDSLVAGVGIDAETKPRWSSPPSGLRQRISAWRTIAAGSWSGASLRPPCRA